MLKLLVRSEIDTDAWDACVFASTQRIVYGYSWYLDIVLPAPSWKWAGLVLIDETEQYQAVMPIPLRRKQFLRATYNWVVHQPFFCQFLAVFSRDSTLDLTPFFRAIQQHFRYGSILNVRQISGSPATFDLSRTLSTQTLDLSVGYQTIHQRYTHDRRLNLRRALRVNWIVLNSTDPEPLLCLFRENHAHSVPGGVTEWAYDILRNVISELSQRGLATLRYATRDAQIEAGALFVQEGNRIIYLFNAASAVGRQGNARTLLIDQVIQENAGCDCLQKPLIFDFESPDKPSIRNFYRSFGAVEEPFWSVRWNRLTAVERLVLHVRDKLKKESGIT